MKLNLEAVEVEWKVVVVVPFSLCEYSFKPLSLACLDSSRGREIASRKVYSC